MLSIYCINLLTFIEDLNNLSLFHCETFSLISPLTYMNTCSMQVYSRVNTYLAASILVNQVGLRDAKPKYDCIACLDIFTHHV